MNRTCRRALVRGFVQGVGFRYFAQRCAEQQRVAGWVRNLPDGCVEAQLEGERAGVELVIEQLRRGPPSARVEEVAVEEAADEGARGFEIRRGAR